MRLQLIFLLLLVLCECSLGKIDFKQVLQDGFSVSLLPEKAPLNLWKDKTTLYAKLSELDHNENNPGDRFYGFIPVYLASLFPNVPSSKYDAKCFKEYSAQVSSFNDEGAEITIKVAKKSSPLCVEDLFLFATQTSLRFHIFHDVGSYTLNFTWVSPFEKQNVLENGFIVFYLPDGVIGSVLDIWETYQLFNSPKSLEDGIKFYKDHMDVTFVNRTAPNFIPDESEVMDGDYIGTLSFQTGPEGEGLSTLIAWGTGGHTSHTAICLRINGTLYVMESSSGGITKTPYRQWMNPSSDVLVVMARLRPELQEKFNNESAIAFFNKVDGLPYGYENFVFGWIDTLNGNYPPPATGEDIPTLLTLMYYLIPSAADLIFGKGLNLRLGTTGLSIMQILDECDARNISAAELVTYPEQDNYIYSNPTGPRMVCDVFVLSMYKQAGIFGDLEFQATELTPKDSYQLQIFDKEWQRPQGCADHSQAGICQVTGMYWLELPGFNTIPPYANMDQKCSAIPTEYIRTPVGC